MNWNQWLILGFVSTVILTTLMSASQGLGMTRMNIPYMLGTILTPNRDRAKILGVLFHLINGWIFSLLYVITFEIFNSAMWWLGALFGLIHSTFVLMVGMPILPGMHPRMASEHQGPKVVRQLEPPGFLALNYGLPTPLSVILAHLIFGMILGGFYQITS